MSLHSISFPATTNNGVVASSAFADSLANLSCSLWVKFTESGNFRQIVSKVNDTTGNGGWEINHNTSGHVFVQFWQPSAAGFRQYTSTAAINDGNWHNIVIAYDSTVSNGTVTVYIDGVVDTGSVSGSGVGANYSNSITWAMGDPLDSSGSFSGNLAYVQIWNTTLTSGNAATLAAGGSVPSGLIGQWPLTEGSGTTTTDTVSSRVVTFNTVTWSTDIPAQLGGVSSKTKASTNLVF